MSRKTAPKKKTIKSNIQEPCNSWLILLKGDLIEGTEYKNDIEILRHPRTREAALFLFSDLNSSVHEILTYSEDKRSWFIDETVKSDGKIKLSAPIDPIFLVLPYLRKQNENVATPLDQILCDAKYPATERLLKCSGLKYLKSIAEEKGCQDIIAYKYNEGKTLEWLKKKSTKLACVLKQKNIHLTSDATSSTFKKVDNGQSVDDNVFLGYAAGIVSDYLEEDLGQKFLKHLNLPVEEAPTVKRKSNIVEVRELKKTKFEEGTPAKQNGKLGSKIAKAASATSKAKSRAAANTRSITSFFKKT